MTGKGAVMTVVIRAFYYRYILNVYDCMKFPPKYRTRHEDKKLGYMLNVMLFILYGIPIYYLYMNKH